MVELAELADVITPNRTEAALLLGADYGAVRLDSEAACALQVLMNTWSA